MKRWIALLALFLAGCGARSGLDIPDEPPGPRRVTSLALGDNHSCALLSDGTAACWGEDLAGELGDVGSGPNHAKPIALKDAVGIVDLAAGNEITCAVLDDGTVECWGLDSQSTHYVPPTVLGAGFSKVAPGDGRGCGQLRGGAVRCWDFITGAKTTIDDLDDAVEIGVGTTLACALRSGGRVSCWGSGPLGDGTKMGSATPVDVVGLHDSVQQIAVGAEHACALLDDESVACWGHGTLGLAKETDTSGLTAASVPGLEGTKRISAHSYQACAVLTDGTVRHWGTDYNPGTGSAAPEPVPDLPSAVNVASGEFHNCALLANGRVACWGENYQGELGDGTNQASETPVTVRGLP